MVGAVIAGKYRIESLIGSGGMANVYKAYDEQEGRTVAIKMLKAEHREDTEFLRRFEREAKAVITLSHPNIVQSYDVGVDEKGVSFIVLEYVHGQTLKDYIKSKTYLSPKEAVDIAAKVLDALGHAHDMGIIHRDVKPQNVIISDNGLVKLTDFGIARDATSTTRTFAGTNVIGSAHYISPEQARGSHIDARADIYSAGVVLYEMLTGRLPFDGDSPVSVAIQHISAKPMSPRELIPDIPLGLEEITMKAMASRIDQRYMNAEAMLRDLEEFRKNPQVEFHYNLASFHGNQPVPDEPTQAVDGASSLGRRQRPPARPRTAPPPRRYPPEEAYEDAQERKRNLVIPIVVVVFLVGVGIFLWLTFFSGLFAQDDALKVPNLLGEKIEDVTQDQEILQHFKIVEQAREPSEDYPEGQIIRQDPDGGTEVTAGEEPITIQVVVSSGKETVEMIDVLGDTYETAVTRLQQLDLKVDTPTREPSDDVEEGKVISSDPVAGTKVSPGDTVRLVISSGPDTRNVTVPTLTGTTLENARNIATSAGLKISSVTEVNSDKPVGQVVYQSIAPNTEVEEGTGIVLQVSKGPEKQEPVTSTKNIEITLPDDERESVEVRITVDGKEVYKNDVSTEQGSFYVPVTGSGVMEICIYFDGSLEKRYSENFNE